MIGPETGVEGERSTPSPGCARARTAVAAGPGFGLVRAGQTRWPGVGVGVSVTGWRAFVAGL